MYLRDLSSWNSLLILFISSVIARPLDAPQVQVDVEEYEECDREQDEDQAVDKSQVPVNGGVVDEVVHGPNDNAESLIKKFIVHTLMSHVTI